jgi:hypothetical protein
MQEAPQIVPAPADDRITLAAIGIVAYTIAIMLHEGVGHVGACLLSGGTPLVISTVHMECSVDTRLVMAGGTLVNFAAAALFFILARTVRRFPSLHLFCWLSMTINLLMASGYFLFSGIGGFGDWAYFVKGLGPEWLLRMGLTALGGTSYMAAVRFSLFELRPLIGSGKEQRVMRAAQRLHLPYYTGGILACVAGALNPAGWHLIALSAAASTFGGTSGLVWMDNWLKDPKRIPLGSQPEPPPIPRSWPWIVVAACAAVLFVALFGPGLRLHPK